ncbi:MAG TPA: hypothetical protein VEO00_07240 [Actinomycetota bacterium]|nr:hypothetical protein [Actinomycetota bacterium]
MPNPTVTVIGSYPRTPRAGEPFTLRTTLQAMDRGEATWEDVARAQDQVVRDVVAEQAAAGVELVTDGQIRWDDAQTRFAAGLEGVTIGSLERYFDNNTYFRQPEIKGPISRRGPIVVDEFRFARAASPVPVKAVVIGPYTLAALSKRDDGLEFAALVRELAVALSEEARDLAAAGATVIAFDEPALARPLGLPEPDPAALEDAFAALVDGVEATTVLQTYFGDVHPLGETVFEWPFDAFGLDLVAGPGNAGLLERLPAGKVLQAGVVDGRNTKLEPVEEVASRLRWVAERVPLDRVWVAPSCGLEFMGREPAQRKLESLARAAREVGE